VWSDAARSVRAQGRIGAPLEESDGVLCFDWDYNHNQNSHETCPSISAVTVEKRRWRSRTAHIFKAAMLCSPHCTSLTALHKMTLAALFIGSNLQNRLWLVALKNRPDDTIGLPKLRFFTLLWQARPSSPIWSNVSHGRILPFLVKPVARN